jgi:chemotaxis protein CheD
MSEATDVTHVSIGGSIVGQPGAILEANLGSCLGIAIIWPEEGTFGLAHCLLPKHPGTPTERRFARFADTAPRYLLRRLRVPPKRLGQLRAVIGGGAAMYADSTACVGRQNVLAGRRALRQLGVRIAAQDVGDEVPRRIRVHGESLTVSVVRMLEKPTTKTWSPD